MNLFGYKITNSKYNQMKIVETPKFIFRPATFRDANDIFEYLSQEKVVKYLPFKAHKNLNDTKKFIKLFFIDNYNNNKVGNYVVYHKLDKKIIGNAGINNAYINSKSAQAGVCINPLYWGNNYATELTFVTILTAFELANLNTLTVLTYSDNKYTTKCLDELGFKYIKTYKPRINLPLSHLYKISKFDYLALKKEYFPKLAKSFEAKSFE